MAHPVLCSGSIKTKKTALARRHTALVEKADSGQMIIIMDNIQNVLQTMGHRPRPIRTDSELEEGPAPTGIIPLDTGLQDRLEVPGRGRELAWGCRAELAVPCLNIWYTSPGTVWCGKHTPGVGLEKEFISCTDG